MKTQSGMFGMKRRWIRVLLAMVVIVGALYLVRRSLFGQWTTYVIEEGSHRPSFGDRAAGWMRGLHGFTFTDTLEIEVVFDEPAWSFGDGSREPFSGKLFGATRGFGWPLERLRFGADELADVFHEQSDRFAFHVDDPTVTLSAYPYVDAARPWENLANRTLGRFSYGDTLRLGLVRRDSSTKYIVGDRDSLTIRHARQLLSRLGWLAGPYAGGADPAPSRLIVRMRRSN